MKIYSYHSVPCYFNKSNDAQLSYDEYARFLAIYTVHYLGCAWKTLHCNFDQNGRVYFWCNLNGTESRAFRSLKNLMVKYNIDLPTVAEIKTDFVI